MGRPSGIELEIVKGVGKKASLEAGRSKLEAQRKRPHTLPFHLSASSFHFPHHGLMRGFFNNLVKEVMTCQR
jgi:hypothetical protein